MQGKALFDSAPMVEEVVHRFRDECKIAGCEIRSEIEPQIVGFFDHFPKVVMRGIRDRGPGIPKDAQSRIFERFERVVPVSGISGLGRGALFSVALPLAGEAEGDKDVAA
ncbi:MAG: hypothetical protein AB1540_07675 [Bdellovibrionota bacterium]